MNLLAFMRIMQLASRWWSKVSLKGTIPSIYRLSIFIISNYRLFSRFKWINLDLRRMWLIYLLSFCLSPHLKNMLKALVCLSYPRSHDCRNQGEVQIWGGVWHIHVTFKCEGCVVLFFPSTKVIFSHWVLLLLGKVFNETTWKAPPSCDRHKGQCFRVTLLCALSN